jgi:hypothetical protein
VADEVSSRPPELGVFNSGLHLSAYYPTTNACELEKVLVPLDGGLVLLLYVKGIPQWPACIRDRCRMVLGGVISLQGYEPRCP